MRNRIPHDQSGSMSSMGESTPSNNGIIEAMQRRIKIEGQEVGVTLW